MIQNEKKRSISKVENVRRNGLQTSEPPVHELWHGLEAGLGNVRLAPGGGRGVDVATHHAHLGVAQVRQVIDGQLVGEAATVGGVDETKAA